ncbi:hypothetical protein [Bradyrhizobium erythrophlei]|uniref:Uncharacterized protein n=1 Tax=Bradyrhizobium erythrophlei TaxID=1437360 RepID=A0A1M7T9C4_9BRAD|nr:hypothetical protein [Bradyrhizobium erythrophlei]SHN67292.1 hypothetical protein SAMN05444170_1156 [Bradyrhizobium erythrophlei]
MRSEEVDGRDLVERIDLLIRSQRDGVVGVAHDGEQPLEGGLGDAGRKRLLVKRGDEGIEDSSL